MLIIIPTFKPGGYLKECLLSISCQDVDFNLFTVFIVLNGPKEPYWSQVEQWLSEMNFNYKLLYSEKANVSSARNLALDLCKSDFVTFLDDDDILSTNYLSSMLENRVLDGVLVANTYQFLDGLSNVSNDYLTFNESFSSDNLIINRKYLSNACCKLIPMCLIGNARFNTNLKLSEDAVFMFEISKNIRFIKSTSPDTIYYRRLRTNSASRQKLSFFIRFKNFVFIALSFLSVYIKDPLNYNFLLLVTRVLASFKRFFLTIK